MNGNFLLGEIKKRGITVKQFCDLIEMSASAFYKKIRGRSEFTRKEMSEICIELEIPLNQIPQIFFNDKVS